MRSGSPALALLLLLAGACDGSIEEPSGGAELGPGEVSPDTPPVVEDDEPLVLTSERLRLLPFSVRLARVAAVAGVAADDPLLEPLVRRAVELGAPEYASGIQADAIWNASKIAIWADALEPICASPQMRARYPSFPESLGAFVEQAYGRRLAPEDETSLEPLRTATIDDERRYVLTCMTLLQ